MAYTISFQNRPTMSREHNIRNPKVTLKEDHIDPKGHFEVWHDETLRDAYNRIFGEAVAEYNAKQPRADRKILDYLSKVQKSSLRHPSKPAYEAIVQVGNRDNKPPEKTSRAILRQFYEEWRKANPNLEIIGAYYHADEKNGTPHLHIDYVPYADGYKRGMKKQHSLSKALEMQGFKGMTRENDRAITPQQRWQFKEVARLEEICRSERFDLNIYHPKREHREHLHKQDYILQQKVLEKDKELLAVGIMLQGQPNDLKTLLDAELWQEAKPFMQKLKVKSGKSVYDYFKENHPEKFLPWKEQERFKHLFQPSKEDKKSKGFDDIDR